MKIYSQKNPKWANLKLGNSNSKIGDYGCFLVSLSMLVEKEPPEVNEILKKAGAFSGDMIISDKAAKALGLEIIKTGDPIIPNRDKNINNEPQYTSIKEVDFSPVAGKQQHFVLRVVEDGKKWIIDPWTGKKQVIGFYPFVSYRLFKAPEKPSDTLSPTCDCKAQQSLILSLTSDIKRQKEVINNLTEKLADKKKELEDIKKKLENLDLIKIIKTKLGL